ncbi:hypothetical protein [Nocardia miyunensis]|uniref:hypothetical protein n=1 Tax=Nocardia miyunensis TaxID=282684 RepID=UPI0008324DE7|nr:hypothetical protein [Nocardia miyunensis]
MLDQRQLCSCHDPETEVLTRHGWLPFPALTMENELATVDPESREVTFERPLRVVAKRYTGDLCRVSNTSKDFAVTPDHHMLVRKWNERYRRLDDRYSFVNMADIGWYSGLMASVHQAGGTESYTIPGIPGYKRASQREDLTVSMPACLRFLGIYLAEGTMIKPTGKSPNKIQIAAFKDREKTFVRAVLSELGVRACELRDRFTFENGRIYRHLEGLGLKGVHAADKFVPRFVFEQSSESIEELLRGHREGDGSLQNDAWTHHTTSPQLADDLQELAFLAGYKTGRSVRAPRVAVMRDGREVRGKRPEYSVRALKGSQSSIERNKEVSSGAYDGMVYSAEVSTFHTLVTRRNGRILISGSCTHNAPARSTMGRTPQ